MRWLRAAAVAGCTGLAAPLAAEEAQLPALFRVTGVSASDGLNLRERPEAGAPVLGQLAPDAEDVEVAGLSRDGSWGLVNQNDRSAWVAMRFLTRQEGAPWWEASVPLSCYGTEPFWGLSIGDGTARFDSPEGQDPPADVSLRSAAAGQLGLRIGEGFAVIRGQTCSDGMSGRANGLAIDLFRAGPEGLTGYSGCCSLLR